MGTSSKWSLSVPFCPLCERKHLKASAALRSSTEFLRPEQLLPLPSLCDGCRNITITPATLSYPPQSVGGRDVGWYEGDLYYVHTSLPEQRHNLGNGQLPLV